MTGKTAGKSAFRKTTWVMCMTLEDYFAILQITYEVCFALQQTTWDGWISTEYLEERNSTQLMLMSSMIGCISKMTCISSALGGQDTISDLHLNLGEVRIPCVLLWSLIGCVFVDYLHRAPYLGRNRFLCRTWQDETSRVELELVSGVKGYLYILYPYHLKCRFLQVTK